MFYKYSFSSFIYFCISKYNDIDLNKKISTGVVYGIRNPEFRIGVF